jgi:hypothetical protein
MGGQGRVYILDSFRLDSTLLVAEFDNNRVQRFTPEGESLDGWGGPGSADGQFGWAMDAAADAEGACS